MALFLLFFLLFLFPSEMKLEFVQDNNLTTLNIITTDFPVSTAASSGNRTLLLPNSTTATRAPPLAWGKGIRMSADRDESCFPSWKSRNAQTLFVRRVASRIGPVFCSPFPDASVKEAIVSDHLDMFAQLRWLTHVSGVGFLYPHEQNDVCLIVQRVKPTSKSILSSFTQSTWLATCVSVTMFGLALWLAGHNDTVFETFRTFLFGMFAVSYFAIRNFLSLFLSVFGLVVVTAFCGKFTSFLAVNEEASQPQTLLEIDARIDKLFGLESFSAGAKYYETEVVKSLLTKMVPWPWQYLDMVDNITNSPKAALILSRLQYELFRRNPRWVDLESGRSLTYLVPDCILSPAYGVFVTNPFWPHADRFSAVLQRAVEAGIHFKSQSDMEFEYQIKGVHVREVAPSNDPKPLTLHEMLEPAVVLITGSIFSVVAFVVECVANRWRQRPQQRKKYKSHNLKVVPKYLYK